MKIVELYFPPAFKLWKDRFKVTASAQGVEDVLTDYIPQTQEQLELFEEQQKYVFSVLTEHLKTMSAPEILTEHAKRHDAQAVFKELCKHKETALTGQLNEEYRREDFEGFVWTTPDVSNF